ncbi:hypothetical protein FQR65_LT12642 [Abscondita terminalis]|nr:hypothetical protein FQR65_LT12642 [Abscondita terminalis]
MHWNRFVIPLHFYMAKITSVYRAKSATRTDERIRLMNEIINGIYVIKMFTWEQLFIKLILLYRMLEMKAIRINAHLKGIYSACVNFNSRIAIFLTLLSYVLINNKINAKQVFVLTGLYNLLRQTMLVCFPYGITLAAETNVCLKRINDFLLLEEISNTSETIDLQNEAISLRNISAQWSKTSQPILSKINLNIPVGKLTAIIGSVGSGKSSLLNVILKEIPITEGDVLINGRVSYAVQEPWLFHQNVQQNILFGSKLDHRRYQEVVKSCALETDFRRLPHSDLSMVSERGASLSGGQKARINLARAVYKDADIYLLDDPLSGVDVHVGKQIFENCINTLLKGKTVVLVTHQLNYLSNVNHIVVLEKGSIVAQGTFSELQKCNSDFVKYLRTESDEHNFNKTTKLESSKVSVSERKIETLAEAPERIIIGSVSESIYRKYIRSGANLFCASAILAIFIALQILVSGLDYFLAYWVNIKQTIGINRSQYKLHLMIYSGFIIVIVFMSLLRSFLFVEMCTKASIYLHNTTFRNVIHGTLKFFLSNPSGRILNRFSKDMGTIDELLPTCIMDTIIIGLVVLGIVVVTIIVNVWLILPILVISIVLYYLRILYIGTSRSIKRLEAVTKSPMIEYLNATVRGLTTIRAAGTQHILIEEFDNHHDLNTSASFLFLATSKAFGFWLDMVCAVYITIVTLSCLFSENGT